MTHWRATTWVAIAWTAILWLFEAALIGMAIQYGGSIYIDTAVFGGAGLLIWWLVGLGIVAAARGRSDRRRFSVTAEVGAEEGGLPSDVARAPSGRVESPTIVRIAMAATAGLIASVAVRTVLAIGLSASAIGLVAGGVVAGAILGARGWRGWAMAVLLVLAVQVLLGQFR